MTFLRVHHVLNEQLLSRYRPLLGCNSEPQQLTRKPFRQGITKRKRDKKSDLYRLSFRKQAIALNIPPGKAWIQSVCFQIIANMRMSPCTSKNLKIQYNEICAPSISAIIRKIR
jgi:hypothetical protein